jgi:hypothetical protein
MKTSFLTCKALKAALFCLVAVAAAGAGPAGAQTMVNVATDQTDPLNLTDSEPSISVNPLNPSDIAIVTFSEPWEAQVGAPVWRSLDGGVTWTKTRVIPRPATRGRGPGDQFLAYDAAGRLFVAELELPSNGGRFPFNYVYRQNTVNDTALTAGGTYGDDQPLLAVDRTAGRPCSNRIYSPWLKFPRETPPRERVRSMVSHSANDGTTMTDVGAGDHSTHPNRTTRIAVGQSDGSVYIIYKVQQGSDTNTPRHFERAQFRVTRSDDCGLTWSGLSAAGTPVHGPNQVLTWYTNEFGDPTKGPTNRARSSDAWIAVDPRDGDVYAAYVKKDDSGFGQLYVARSTDRGATWTSTRATDGLSNAAFPVIAVTDNGSVGLLYVDYEISGNKIFFRHRFARSADNGASWTQKTLQSMDPSVLIHPKDEIDTFIWGDYEGLTAIGNTFYGVFTGQSLPGKRTKTQLDPIFFTEPATPQVAPATPQAVSVQPARSR